MLPDVLKVHLCWVVTVVVGSNDGEGGRGMREGALGSGGDVECPLVFSFQMADCGAKGEGDNEGEGKDGEEGDGVGLLEEEDGKGKNEDEGGDEEPAGE
ncbi:uncharacterized protein FIBRA_09503 [Fibroporia radiculosa]|uniref:Uncharacterized protein n=1 Tax=Fibroporia radiculosa TaxID=599839 RepID=J7S6L3_9APHY|nr:uncharacterized protein FIBRA_09503 [Fibroporia radiculosa]CCM07164.1 predicted protein [Fibroporia radiculosa]